LQLLHVTTRKEPGIESLLKRNVETLVWNADTL